MKFLEFLPKNIDINIKIEVNLAKSLKNLVFELGFSGKKIIFISDEKIYKNCEKFFEANFEEIFNTKLILKNPKADEETLEKIQENLENNELIIALGSGTINDLCKFISFKNSIPYAIFPSAPSMNGYLSKNASIEINNHKKTLSATLPKAVFCDLEILKNAPSEMIKAGIGDSMCFYSCWFDWLLSNLLLETEFNSDCFSILFDEMADFAENYKKFSLKDELFLEKLIKILLLSGLAMTLANSSNPASQSEHLIAHSYSMKYPKKSEKILHGLQIATTTLTSAKIQEELIAQDFIEFREPNFSSKEIADFFGQKIMEECKKEYLEKYDLIKKNRKILIEELSTNWQSYCKILSKILFCEEKLREIFNHFQIETGAKFLGLEHQEYNEIIANSKFIRNRFTCLDL